MQFGLQFLKWMQEKKIIVTANEYYHSANWKKLPPGIRLYEVVSIFAYTASLPGSLAALNVSIQRLLIQKLTPRRYGRLCILFMQSKLLRTNIVIDRLWEIWPWPFSMTMTLSNPQVRYSMYKVSMRSALYWWTLLNNIRSLHFKICLCC